MVINRSTADDDGISFGVLCAFFFFKFKSRGLKCALTELYLLIFYNVFFIYIIHLNVKIR